MKSWPVPLPEAGSASPTRYLNRLPAIEAGSPGSRRRGRRFRSDMLAAASGRSVAETIRSAFTAPSVAVAVDHVVDAAMGSGPWDACGLSVIEADGALRSLVRPSSTARRLDELQYLIGEGPVLDVVSAEPMLQVMSADLVNETRWPGWVTAATAASMRTVLTLRLFTDVTIGALSFYGRHRACADRVTLAAAHVAAAQASVVLVYAQCQWRLRNAIDAQNAIGLAQGDPDAASWDSG